MAAFSDEQMRRYSRQILLREVGGRGQAALLAAQPVLLAVGAVGQVAADYLWRAGVTGLSLYCPTVAAAQALDRELAAAGHRGSAVQALDQAPHAVRERAGAAPGCTLLWPDGQTAAEPLWASAREDGGAMGQGLVALRDELTRAVERATAPAGGAAAMIVGSALALLALQRLLRCEPASVDGALWEVDLTRPTPPGWRRPAVESGGAAQRSG